MLEFDPAVLNNHARLARVVVEECGCWGLTRHKRHTYASLTWKSRVEKAHRVSYMLYKGKIPEGLVIDHGCKHVWCVNPAHLEAVTQQENLQRGPGSVTMCKHGHDFTEENTYRQPGTGRRSCKICRKAANMKWNKHYAHTS